MQYRYASVLLSVALTNELDKALNRYAEEGWEVVTVTFSNDGVYVLLRKQVASTTTTGNKLPKVTA